MELSLKYFILIIAINVEACEDSDVIELKIKQGDLSGKIEKTFLKKQSYYSFKGIPYAKPPIRQLRFKPPEVHEGWNGIYEAHSNKPTCFQFNSRMRMGEPFGMSGSEDCLYLSVFTPDLKGSAPVVVFDYNDNFRTGFNSTDTYSPDFFMEENVIVVTINYRLGILGYLTTEDDVIPANAGLKDFIMGLNWIKENIKQFGGDPDRVTLMGSQGGAVIVDILLRSDRAKNLFSGAILQSGTALESNLFDSSAREKAFIIGQSLNITTQDSTSLLEGLQKIDLEILYSKESNVVNNDVFNKSQISYITFTPTIELEHPDAVLTYLPDHGKIINDVPVMIGMNSREGLDLVSHLITEPRLLKDLGQDFLFIFPIRTDFRFDRNSTIYDEAIKEILNFYFKEGYLYYGNILEYGVYVADILQNYALNEAVKKLSEKLQSSVYYYQFDFRGSLNENSIYVARYARFSIQHWGATITDDLCYLHLCSRIKKNYQELTKLVSEQKEIKVLRRMLLTVEELYLPSSARLKNMKEYNYRSIRSYKISRISLQLLTVEELYLPASAQQHEMLTARWKYPNSFRNPTPAKDDEILKNLVWKPVNNKDDNISYLHISKIFQMKVNPLGDRAKFWDNFLKKYSEHAVDGLVQTSETHDEL